VVVSQGLDVDGGDETFKNWVWNDLDVEGCLRTRTYKCIDNLRTGTGVGDGLEEQKVPKYLMIHGVPSTHSVIAAKAGIFILHCRTS
jgi:hypothetical protein